MQRGAKVIGNKGKREKRSEAYYSGFMTVTASG